MIMLKNGAKIPFKQWREEIEVFNDDQESIKPNENLDKDRLNRIITECSAPGALFGRDINLTASDVDQLKKVTEIADQLISKSIRESKGYSELEGIIEQLAKEGSIMSFGYFPPSWLKNGGESQKRVEITRNEKDLPTVIVPDRVYWEYYYKNTNDYLKKNYVDHPPTSGTDAIYLGKKLSDIGHLLKSNNLA